MVPAPSTSPAIIWRSTTHLPIYVEANIVDDIRAKLLRYCVTRAIDTFLTGWRLGGSYGSLRMGVARYVPDSASKILLGVRLCSIWPSGDAE